MKDAFCCPLCKSSMFTALFVEEVAGTSLPVVRCVDCNLIQTHPQPDAEFTRRLYAEGYQDALSGSYCSEGQLDCRNHESALARLASTNVGKVSNILDVGCGIGNFMAVAQAAGHQVHGLETSPVAAGKASVRFPGRIHRGILDDAAFPGRTFDVISMWYVLEHVEDPPALVRMAAARCRLDGAIIIAVPNWTYIRLRRFVQRLRGGTGCVDAQEHLFQFTWSTVQRMCTDAGLHVEWKAIPTPYAIGSAPVRMAKTLVHIGCRVVAALTGFRFGGIMLIARVKRV